MTPTQGDGSVEQFGNTRGRFCCVDRQARWAGVKYYYDRNNKWWAYYALYGGKPKY